MLPVVVGHPQVPSSCSAVRSRLPQSQLPGFGEAVVEGQRIETAVDPTVSVVLEQLENLFEASYGQVYSLKVYHARRLGKSERHLHYLSIKSLRINLKEVNLMHAKLTQ